MYLNKEIKELAQEFEKQLLETNRGFNYYVDWSNVGGYERYSVEIHALDVLIRKKMKISVKHFGNFLQNYRV